MGFSDRQKQAGIRLELTWFEARQCWKKKHNEKIKYLKFPDTKAGYEAALQEWFKFKNETLGKRKNVEVLEHYATLFTGVQSWYDVFGTPVSEAKLFNQVSAFLAWLEELKQESELPEQLPIISFCTERKRPEFYQEFVWSESGYSTCGYLFYELPPKWIDRLDRAGNQNLSKEPQTIGHWLEKYLNRVDSRAGTVIREKTADDRRYKLVRFSKFCDKLAHVSTITSEYVEEFHLHLDKSKIKKGSKEGYFKAFKMFVRWCSQTKSCELTAPEILDSREFQFREPLGTGRKRQEKKSLLWTKEELHDALKILDDQKACCLLLMLNCGFRHVDLGELRHVDYHVKEGRIVIQRQKLNQQDSAPVISYKLWDKTIELLEKVKSDTSENIFVNRTGGTVEESLKVWWKRNGSAKRLDYLRKTGATSVSRFDNNGDLDNFYLGESLTKTSKLHYSFTDGEPCQALDDAIQNLGAEFGFCEKPFQRVQLTPEMLKKLQEAEIDIASL